MKIAVFLSCFAELTAACVVRKLAATVGVIGAFILPLPAAGGDVKIFDDGTVALWARTNLIAEDPIPVYQNSILVDDPATPASDLFDGIEIYDQVPGTRDFPLTWVDLIGNCFVRATYQKSDGTTANLGTSVVVCPSFRTSQGDLRFIPTSERAEVETNLTSDVRIRNTLKASYKHDVNITSIRTYPDPPIALTNMGLSVQFDVVQPISLNSSQLGSDAFRFITLSSMFSTDKVYDANILRWQTPDGTVKSLRLRNSTPRDSHLLPSGTQLGCWFELVKETGSTWFSDSPTIRVDILDCGNVTEQLGIQGFLAATPDPNDDSLSVWLEWLNVPNPISAGTSLSFTFSVSASSPKVPPALGLGSWRFALPNEQR